MKSILFLVFAALCSASLPRYSNEGVDMAERAPTMYDAATDEDITAYLKQALEQDTELKSFLADLDDDDVFKAELNKFFSMDDDEFDDGLNDELLLKEIENFDSLVERSSINDTAQVRQPFDSMTNKSRQGQSRQLSIFESFGINGPAAKVQHKVVHKNTVSKPALASRKPSIVYEPRAKHNLDVEAFKTWIYPINYTVRDYQYNIVQKALFSNTLVALPTGLGKTFIAAVVMYNFYRWFPNGKLIFMAPTKPLVNQQIEACYRITGLPKEMTEELTGSKSPEFRRLAWKMKRVFFITPQILQNDLNTNVCTPDDIVLLVFDEAHRASKNYAYCELMKSLISKHASFRVLALTATPGSDITSVANVVQNLIITQIEIRTEDSIDISKYIHTRSLELIVVPISEDIKKLTDLYCQVMNIFLKKLNDQNVYRESNPLNVSNFALLKAREAFRKSSHSSNRPPQLNGYIEGAFGVTQTLAIAYSNLVQHGINLFYSSLLKYDKNVAVTKLSKAGRDLSSNSQFTRMMSLIREMKAKPDFLTHLKMEKLLHVILEHFRLILDEENKSNSRVIVFTQYRESVEEIVSLLSRHAVLRVMSFVGQSTGNKGTKGLTQKEQLEVIRQFKAGNYNVLVCTSIGEEGLDIGEIDLIVCYDSQNSPIRMLQRMGRTGRKRKGKVVLLLTQGREEEAYNRAQFQYKSVQNAIATQQGNKIVMFAPSLDVIPINYGRPECQMLKMNIDETPTNDLLKGKFNSATEETATQDIYLNAEESLDYRLQFHIPPENSSNISLGRYMYRSVMSLPLIHLERSERSLAFNNVMAELEGLVALEEERLMIKSAGQGKIKIRNIEENKWSSPLSFDIGRTLRIRSKVEVTESDSWSPIPLNGKAKSLNNDRTIEIDSDYVGKDTEERTALDMSRSDTTLGSVLQIAIPVNVDNFLDNNLNCKGSDNEGNLMSDQLMIRDAGSPCINLCNQDALDQMLDIDPNEWIISYEDIQTLSPKWSRQELTRKEDEFNDLEPEKLQHDMNGPNGAKRCPPSSQTPIIKARKKNRIIIDGSSSAKSDVFVRPAPIIYKSGQKRSGESKNTQKKKKKKIGFSNPYFDLEAGVSDTSGDSGDEEDSNIDMDGNLSGLIAESQAAESQEINYYRKSLLSPEFGGLGTKKHMCRFTTPKRYDPCTQLMPDSDTPGSLANFVVDDESFEKSGPQSEQLDTLSLNDVLEIHSSGDEL